MTDLSVNYAQRLREEIRDARIRDIASERYDAFAEDLAKLGDEMASVGGDEIAQTCRDFAFIAWRAARAEHLNPDTEGL